MSDIKNALGAIRDLAKVFAPLATVGADIDRLDALVSHEDELTAGIAAKLAQSADIDADNAIKLSACDAEIATRQQTQRDAEAGYQARMDALNVEYQTARTSLRTDIDNAKIAVKKESDALIRDVEELRNAAYAERQRVQSEHDAFIEQTKAHRASIEARTKEIEARLDTVRDQAKGALAAVEVESTPQA